MNKEEHKLVTPSTNCANHPGQLAEFLCEDCATLLCIRCRNLHAKSHRMVRYKEEAISLMDTAVGGINEILSGLAPAEPYPAEEAKCMEIGAMTDPFKSTAPLAPVTQPPSIFSRELLSASLSIMHRLESEGRFLELYHFAKDWGSKLASPFSMDPLRTSLGAQIFAEEPIAPPVFSVYDEKETFSLSDDSEENVMTQLSLKDWEKYAMIHIDGARMIGDLTVQAVSLVVEKYPNIHAVYLGGDRISDTGVQNIAKAVRSRAFLHGVYCCIFLGS